MTAAVDSSRHRLHGSAQRTPHAPPASPVFVVGAPFSGASTLAWALAQHPGLEAILGGDSAGSLLTALRVLDEDLLPLIAKDVIDPIRSALDRFAPSSALAGANLVDAIAHELTGRDSIGRSHRHWIVSGPECLARIGVAFRLFPELRLIHVHRSADAVVKHLAAAAERDGVGLSPRAAEAIWERSVRASVDAEQLVGRERVLRLSYEWLVHNPREALRECLALLDERWHEGCVWPLRLLTTDPDRLDPARTEPTLPPPRPVAGRSRPPGPCRPLHRQLRRLVETVVPAGATILVASRGDDDLLHFRGRKGAHFPQVEGGEWAGFYPADGNAAVEHLRALRVDGATHLLFPQSALWWLDHYPELRLHLEQCARLVACDTDLCAVWQLDSEQQISLPASLQTTRRTPTEPDNRVAFLIERRTAPTKRPRALGGSLWAVTTYYNPASYASKATNYAWFREALHEADIPLLAVELAFGDTPFELGSGDAEKLIQLRGGDVLWQKERLLNIGVASLPDDCDKVAWLDADVLFARPDWARETARLLDTYVVVQPFSHCVRLPPETGVCDPATLPFGYGESELFYGMAWGVHAKGRASLADYRRHGHTGFAWAARRELIERHGLYDANLLGNGDTDIAHALFGSTNYWGQQKLGQSARSHLRRWAEPFTADVARSVGCVDGVVSHLWHGSPQHRLYDKPLDVLRNFDPDCDLAVNPQTGLYEWSNASNELRSWSEHYFRARQEDG